MEKKAITAVFVLLFGFSLLGNYPARASVVNFEAKQENVADEKLGHLAAPEHVDGGVLDHTTIKANIEPFPSTTNTTTAPPKPTTTTPQSTTKPSPPPSPPAPSTTTSSTTTSSTTTSSTTTPSPPTPTPVTTPSPHPTTSTTPGTTPATPSPTTHRGFDAFSFIGGFILAVGLMGIGMVSWKFYVSRQENYYHTL